MDLFAWLRLLAEGGFRVEPRYWYIAGIVTWMASINTMLRWLQSARDRRELARITLDPPPLFVLGHWRTGTTLLHELLSLDDRHTGPITHHCFEPNHLLISESFFLDYLGFLLPGQRPMDNMAFGWRQPQEDEFALALLGEPSTYTEFAFPNRLMGQAARSGSTPLDLSSLSPRQLRQWTRTLVQFLKMVSLLDRRRSGRVRRLVLKSPPHTARIPELLAAFPDARFAYIRRDPMAVYPSTVKLWTSLALKHGLQTPRRPDLIEAKVLKEFRTLIDRYEATKALIPAGRLVETRYEDLIADMPGELARIYATLDLGGWDAVAARIADAARQRRDYVTNRFEPSEAIRNLVTEHWGDICRRWG
jgi:omega-hydroxy-beta-dihydromenaquinone-9 sulfotransferase